MNSYSVQYTGGEYSTRAIFDEIREIAQRERISTIVQFRDLIDEVVEEKRIYGFFSDDEDITQIKQNLELMWAEVHSELEDRAGAPLK